jgi:hypothetical protein
MSVTGGFWSRHPSLHRRTREDQSQLALPWTPPFRWEAAGRLIRNYRISVCRTREVSISRSLRENGSPTLDNFRDENSSVADVSHQFVSLDAKPAEALLSFSLSNSALADLTVWFEVLVVLWLANCFKAPYLTSTCRRTLEGGSQ